MLRNFLNVLFWGILYYGSRYISGICGNRLDEKWSSFSQINQLDFFFLAPKSRPPLSNIAIVGLFSTQVSNLAFVQGSRSSDCHLGGIILRGKIPARYHCVKKTRLPTI